MTAKSAVKRAAALIGALCVLAALARPDGIFAEAASKKSAAKKQTAAARKADVRDTISGSLAKGKPVFVYFYADRIKDSLKELPEVQKAADKRDGVVVKVEAEKDEELRFDYGLDYVPTVFVLRPGIGVVDTFVVDNIIEKEILRNTDKNFKPSPGLESIGKGVKAKKPALLFFMADWCGYCRKMTPEVEGFRKDYGDQINVVQINIEADYRAGDLYLVNGVPVIVMLDANGSIFRRTGYPSGYKDFEKVFKEMGVKLTKKSSSGGGK